MDDRHFDTLARVLGAGISRRRTLAVMAAPLSGGALLSALSGEAVALSRKQRRRYKRDGGAVCSAGTKRECCSSKSGQDGAGKCVHGACSCDATLTYAEDNGCPVDARALPGERCGCHPYVGGSFPAGACVDRNSSCGIEGCDTNADCRAGSICLEHCQEHPDPPDPLGHEGRRCSTPCKPA